MRSSLLNPNRFKLAQQTAPKYTDLYYTIPEACASHKLIDSFDFVKVLRLSEGRPSFARDAKQSFFLECPSITLSVLENTEGKAENFVEGLYETFLMLLSESVIDVSLLRGNSTILAETPIEVQSFTLCCKTQPHKPCKSNTVKNEIQQFPTLFWTTVLNYCLSKSTTSFETYFYSEDSAINAKFSKSLTYQIKRTLLERPALEADNTTVSGSVRLTVEELTKQKALYKVLGYKESYTPFAIGVEQEITVQDDPVITIIAKDVSIDDSEELSEEVGLLTHTYMVFSYFLNSDTLIALSCFEALTDIEVKTKFNKKCASSDTVPKLIHKTHPRLFSDIFMEADSAFKVLN